MQMATKAYFEQAIEAGHAKIIGEGKPQRVHYIAANHSERWSDPEEKVRAEFWAELIYKYQYRPERIGFEVKVPRRTPHDLADLVIYGDQDDELKSPWFVFECKRADVSDAKFAQAIEQACGNRASLGANYAGAIVGLTRRLLRFDKFPAGERDKNIIADIPVRYGNPPEWRFYKNEPGKDFAAIPREELRAAIRKCHQTLWEGGRRSPIAAFGEFCKIIFVKHRDEKNLDHPDGKPYAFQRRDGESAEGLAARIHTLYKTEQELDLSKTCPQRALLVQARSAGAPQAASNVPAFTPLLSPLLSHEELIGGKAGDVSRNPQFSGTVNFPAYDGWNNQICVCSTPIRS